MRKEKEIIDMASLEAKKIILEASMVAKKVLAQASETAQSDIKFQEERNTRSLVGALRQVFGENTESGKFIDASKIPLICKNIEGIHTNTKEMREAIESEIQELKKMIEELRDTFISKTEFEPYKWVFRLVFGTITLSIIGAVLSLIIKK